MYRGELAVLLIIISIKGCLLGQTTFNKTYDFSHGIDQVYAVTTINDGYILVGSGYGNEVGAFFDIKIKYAKIDYEGNLVWQKFIGAPDTNFFVYPKSSIATLDGNVIFCGSRQSLTTSEIHLIKINSTTGDTIFMKRFDNDDEIYGLQVRELNDGSLIILGYDSNDSFAFFFIKTTPDGQFVWDKRYGTTTEGYPTEFNIVDDTIYTVNGNYLCAPEGYWIRRMDSNGNVISTNYFNGDCVGNGLKSETEGYYGAGAYYSVPPYQTFSYRTDADGNVLWHYETSIDMDTLEYEQLFPDIVKELPNGDLIVAGYYSSNYLGSYIGLISKINIEGVAYWERFYTATPDPSDDNIIYDIDFCIDGGYILAGSAFGAEESEGQNFWALKLDSVGCLIPGCDTLDINITEYQYNVGNIEVYPNPVLESAIVRINLNSASSVNEVNYTVSDITGRIIYKSINCASTRKSNEISFTIFKK